MASKNARRKRKCKSKIKYNNIRQAQNTIRSLMKINNCQFKYNIYKCPFCGCYHVGHRPTKYY